MIGEVLEARYRILRKIGEGATGKVYLAHNVTAGRNEAIKVLRPSVAVDPSFVTRFRREARATNRAQHANIVSVYDFGRLPDGRLFLAMEYADGPRLDELLRGSGPMPVAQVLHLAGQLALAIGHAHTCGVIHRDLKPSNVILVEHRGQRDVVKVLDFGMAKIIAPEYSELLSVTADGEVFGTPAYMAPEQFRGEGSDPRIDIYAVGCVIFELLVGEPPFLGHNMELMQAHTQHNPETPSGRTAGGTIPSALDDVVMGCLVKDPDRRFQTGEEIYRALELVPGFKTKRAAAGTATTARGLAITAPHDYGEAANESTDSHSFADHFGDALDSADTGKVNELEVAQVHQQAMLELAEALLDYGAQESNVTVSVARLHALGDDVLRTELEQTELRAREEKLEQATREREGSLRFAIGELKFDRDQATDALRPELDTQLEALEQRLADLQTQTQRQLEAITDESISLAAERGALQDQCAEAFVELGSLLEQIVSRYEGDLEIAPLLDRYRAIGQLRDRVADE